MIDFHGELHGSIRGGGLFLDPVWEGFPGQAFGGFIAGALLVAAARETEHPRPLSIHARYLRPVPLARRVSLTVRVGRRGRSVDTLTAELLDGERLLTSASLAFAREGEALLRSQSVPAIAPLVAPRPIAELLDEIGVEPPPLMRRIGFRGEPDHPGLASPPSEPWHLRSQWPGTDSDDAAVRAAVALMPIDNFVGPAAIHANNVDINQPWPVMMPSIDLAAWFYAPEAPGAEVDEACPAGWLDTRTSVPVSHAGYAVGRTQVWSGDRLVAEGMSQVAQLPLPDATGELSGRA